MACSPQSTGCEDRILATQVQLPVHQDRNEQNLDEPIVAVSIRMSATFGRKIARVFEAA